MREKGRRMGNSGTEDPPECLNVEGTTSGIYIKSSTTHEYEISSWAFTTGISGSGI